MCTQGVECAFAQESRSCQVININVTEKYKELLALNSVDAGLILGLRPTNKRRHYKVTTSLIDWAQTYNQS